MVRTFVIALLALLAALVIVLLALLAGLWVTELDAAELSGRVTRVGFAGRGRS